MQFDRNRVYRVKQLAEALDVHRSTIYRAIESGALDALKIGTGKGALRIPGSSVNIWLSDCADAAYHLVEDGASVEALDDPETDDAAEVA
ncbi:helix-turn-helix domain-containing protein [Amycolatopsis sp. cmx-11-32]|uniref:helix-turn-helix domain-containing protein n=1 Tax=Amycolatopsis sp. cmx-11-32 TaxID=2785796 RepID=UPI0039E4912F